MVFCDFFGVAEVFSVVTAGVARSFPSAAGPAGQRSPGRGSARVRGRVLAMRQAVDVLLGGAPGAGSLLLNTKASQEAACSRAPAAIVPGQEPESRDAGVSRFSENGSHLEAAGAAEGHARWVEGPGSSGNTGNGSHLAATDTAESHAGWVEGPGSSGNTGIGSHLEVASVTDAAGVHVSGPGSSEFTKNGSHLAAEDFSDEPGAVL